MTEALMLKDDRLPVVKMHATAVFSILNHFIRRGAEQPQRVVGTLLGVVEKGNVEVTDCFGIPHSEKEDETGHIVNFKGDYHRLMYSFHRMINRQEQVVGWYGSSTPCGGLFNAHTTIIDDEYRKECVSPIHVVVDTTLSGAKMGIRAFLRQDIIVGANRLGKMFHELRVDMAFTPGEAMCMHHMLHDQSTDVAFKEPEVLSIIPNPKNALKSSLKNLVGIMGELLSLVDDVIEGKKNASPEVGIALADAVGLLKAVRSSDFQHIFQDKTQDLIMVSHLASLLQTQITIAEKMYTLYG
jgi:hypothetical protein